MRGGGMRRGGGGGGMNRNSVASGGGTGSVFSSNGRVPFDLTFYEDIFPVVSNIVVDDTGLSAAILKRNTEVTPSTDEIQGIQNLVTRVLGILENLILTPGSFEACQVEEVRQVGSFKQATILAGHKTADLVVILKTLPTREAVEALGNKVADELRQTECVRTSVTPRGFDLVNVQATVRVLITTVQQNLRKLDPEIHLNSKLMNEHWQAIRHSRWFEENAHNSTVKVLVRILRDMRARFAGMQPLSTWMLDILAHYAVTNNPSRTALPINQAFRRTLSLISAGMYLPGYAGISNRGHILKEEDMDLATMTVQTLLRILGQGGYKAILGLENRGDFLSCPSVWDGVVVSHSETVYDNSLEQGDIDEEPAEMIST
jgi:interleukin enhancer-binding factor 2